MLSNYGMKIDKSAKCIAFGIGAKFWRYKKEILRDYNIIMCTDNNINKECCINGVNICPPYVAMEADFDYMLVIPNMHKIEIIESLLEKGIPKDKIVPWFPEMGHQIYRIAEISYEDKAFNAVFDRVKFKAHNSSSILVMNEIFIDGEYECDIGNKMTIIDVGMNVGAASIYFAAMDSVKQVIGFEPFPETLAQAKENIAMQEEDIRRKITFNNLALSDYSGIEKIDYIQDFPGGMSILCDKSANGVEIEVRDAGEVLKPIVDRVDGKILMKIDCEGSEYAIFNSLDKANLFPMIDAFIMETHLGREDEIKEKLKKEGYSYYARRATNGLGLVFAKR